MKKTIFLILAILPIVLLVVIAFAGYAFQKLDYISVERVEFVDRVGSAYTDETVFKVDQGSSKETSVVVYPKLATNQRVTYRSLDPSICTVDANGVIYGVHFGSTQVIVETMDGKKTAILNVLVKADVPFAVYLSDSEITMNMFGVYELGHEVDAPVAVNKAVVFSSDNPEVASVDATGKITSHKPGTAIITVTTVSGNLTDTCTVTVENNLPPIYFDADASDNITYIQSSGRYTCDSKTLDLSGCLILGDEISECDVKYLIVSGGEHASIVNGVLEFKNPNKIVTIQIYTEGKTGKENLIELTIVYTDI